MNNDCELLKLAAKAAGIGYVISLYGNLLAVSHPGGGEMRVWNPLADDGDALRLAVSLELDLSLHGDSALAGDIYNDQWDSYEVYGNDKMAAVRRAIVLAAAERAK